MPKRKFLIILPFLIIGLCAKAQINIRGTIIDAVTRQPIEGVLIVLQPSNVIQETNIKGVFEFKNIKPSTYVALVESYGYLLQSIEISALQDIELDDILLKPYVAQHIGTIVLSDEELDGDDDTEQIGAMGFLQASKDVFQRTAAFDWGAFWFNPRGYNAKFTSVMFNGILMNKANNGRPLWRNWGGLNDVTRYPQELTFGLDPSINNIGNVGGATNFSTLASGFRKGTSISISRANRSYNNRVMATYATGLQPNGWAFTVSGSRRWAEETLVKGTFYDAWAYFTAIEKRFNNKHSFNLTAFGTPYRRGSSSPNTQEVYSLFGNTYNAYWGYQGSEKRNERIRTTFEPTFFLTHSWQINQRNRLQTTVGYQFGYQGSTRLNRGSGYFQNNNLIIANPPNSSPNYYKYLPSYYENQGLDINLAEVYNADNNFIPIKNRQLNWDYIYLFNQNLAAQGKSAAYYMVNDKSKASTISLNSTLAHKKGQHLTINAVLNHQLLKSDNYRELTDLLGGTPFVDVNAYEYGNRVYNNLLIPKKLIKEGNKHNYSYRLTRNFTEVYTLFNFSYPKWDYYVAANANYTVMWREGNYQNGVYQNNSLGKSEKLDFYAISARVGATHKINGRNFIRTNAAFISTAPTLDAVFPNARYANIVTPKILNEQIYAGDISYVYRASRIKAKATGYYTQFKNQVNISRYFAEGEITVGSEIINAGFLTEVQQNVEKEHIGIETAAEVNVTTTLTVRAAASIGQFIYKNNPNVFFINDDTGQFFEIGKATLKNYKVAGSPQQAYSVGLQYRSPKYWWLGASANYLANNYINIVSLKRTNFFVVNPITGVPYQEYTEALAKSLLRQEKFSDEFMLNLNAGKTWRIKKYYLGASLNINNLLNNKNYKTGGFEQARTSNFASALEDANRAQPQFGNRYWYNSGTTYFFNLFVRF